METNVTKAPTQAALDPKLVEQVVLGGDLSKLSPDQRLAYYSKVCDSLGLNPLTKPFEFINLNGKLVMYAKRDCTEQLRRNYSVSVEIKAREVVSDVYVVTAKGTIPAGQNSRHERADESIGAVSIGGLKGEALANAYMKAETKAKRRVTLSICGLGMLDETEVETIPNALPPREVEGKAPPKAQDSESVREAWEAEAVANLSSAVTLEALAAVWANYKVKSPGMIAAKDKRKAELMAAKSSPPEPLPTKGTPIDPNTVGALEEPPPPRSGLMGRVPPKILALIERSAPWSPPETMEVAKAMLPLLGSERWAAEVKANGGDVAKTYFGLAGHDLNMLVAKLVDVASGDSK